MAGRKSIKVEVLNFAFLVSPQPRSGWNWTRLGILTYTEFISEAQWDIWSKENWKKKGKWEGSLQGNWNSTRESRLLRDAAAFFFLHFLRGMMTVITIPRT
jgi:hypothetical protein